MPDRVLPPLRRTAADAEAYARVDRLDNVGEAHWHPQTLEWRDSVIRQADVLKGMPLPILRGLWDQCDGCNSPEGWEAEAIHLALNEAGDGDYCAI